MSTLIKSVGTTVICYCLAWLIAFLSVVGFEPSLMPGYFIAGWNFSGFEIVSFVWLLAWPIFIALLLAYHFAKRHLAASLARTP